MKLTDVPEVDGIEADGFYKFLICHLMGESGEHRQLMRVAYIGVNGEIPRRHYEIDNLVKLTIDEVEGSFTFMTLGGGMLEVRRNKTSIDVFASSTVYDSEPDRLETIAMLQRAYPNAEVQDTT